MPIPKCKACHTADPNQPVSAEVVPIETLYPAYNDELLVLFERSTVSDFSDVQDARGGPAPAYDDSVVALDATLRGGRRGPNYDAASVAAARDALESAGLNPRLVVDCSHANSGKDPARQPAVLDDVLAQRRAGDRTVAGVMLESHLHGGNQALGPDLDYGVSITDACLGWDDTEAALTGLAEGL